ncbi:DEAD/DEAH box helicase family protein [Vibrio harveyi]|nr:DEAD/DEAH box helicase family protein [Vibrio harveyi]
MVTLRNDYYQGYNTARYYQQVAINRAILEVAKGRQKMMIVMATGTGKTFVAYQIIHKLLKSKIKKRVLFIADMNILVDQTINNDFKSLKNKMIKIDSDILKSSEKLNSYEVYLGLYQQLMGKNGEKHYKKFNKNFFDLIIIDEAHRGSARDEST